MNGANEKPGTNVKLEDLYLYFDGVERDRLDTAGTSRRSGEVLALRDRLMRLPEAEFDVVIKTLRSVVSDVAADGSNKTDMPQRARTLYDSVRPASGGSKGSTKVSPT